MNTQKDTLTEEQKADLRKKLMDWNTAKTCIRSYLTTPAKANRFFDRSYPCYKLYNTGLIVTFYLVLSENSDNIEILNIDDRLLHGWNVDIEALKQAAEIGDKARGYKVESLSDLIGEMGDKATQEAYSEVNFLNEYVVTTSPIPSHMQRRVLSRKRSGNSSGNCSRVGVTCSPLLYMI